MTRDYRWLLIGAGHGREPHQEPHSTPAARRAPAGADGEDVRLFVRGDESMRFVIRAARHTLHVFGPGRVQKVHEFPGALELQAFLTSYEQRMLDTGWALLDVSDRRLAGRG
jgi:hypothetical protein